MAKDGGSAFPRVRGLPGKSFEGMSMRQWYAGQALAGLLAAYRGPFAPWVNDEEQQPIASMALKIADAMIKAEQVKP